VISVLHAFADRVAAGADLARAVRRLELQPPLVVLGLPRGGVPIAHCIASALHAPLDVMVVRKIGMPGQQELAVGAVASGGIVVREPGGAARGVDSALFEQLAQRERIELERRERAFRPGLPPHALAGCTVVLADDGIATGATMLAAIRAARRAGARMVVAAAPVASDEAAALIEAEADRSVILRVPAFLTSIGQWYGRFDQLTDEEVSALLERTRPAPRDAGAR
jgi:putative phosphoribosyl transferase